MHSTKDLFNKLSLEEKSVEPLRPINDSWVTTVQVTGGPASSSLEPWVPPVRPTSGFKFTQVGNRIVHHQRSDEALSIEIPKRVFSPIPENDNQNKSTQTDSPMPMYKMSYGRSGCMQ